MNKSTIHYSQHTVFSGFDKYKLACGATVIQAANGDLLCTWLSGGDNEPSEDNSVLLARSQDNGVTWSTPEVFLKGEGDLAAVMSCLYVTDSGKIVAFPARWPHEKEYTEWFYYRIESVDHGNTWKKIKNITIRDNKCSFGSPTRLNNGEYLFPGTYFEKRHKPLTGSVATLADINDENLASSERENGGETDSGKFGQFLHGSFVCIASDENASDIRDYGYISNRPLGLLECTCVQLKDERIVMLMRAEWGGFLWRSESTDNGRTWSQAVQTDIPNPSTMPFLIRLASGRIALIHNATGEKGKIGIRNPLSIWVSDDELESWSIKEDLITSSDSPRPPWQDNPLDQLAYPHGIIINGKLCFVYDRNRRHVMFVETNLE